jgi:hypothetical protein
MLLSTHSLPHAQTTLTTSPSDFLNNVIRVRGANDGDLGGEPLLEGLGDEEAVSREPARHGGANVDCLGEGGGSGGESDRALVDGDMFFGGAGDANLHANRMISNCSRKSSDWQL